MTTEKLSKFLALILRHKPETVGITLDENGYADVATLLANIPSRPSRAELDRVVAEDKKGRYSYSKDGTKIRANQGHSLEVDLGMKPTKPPICLYHGTTTRNLESIFTTGLDKGTRQYVHLSKDKETALQVGSRYGKPELLFVDSQRMHDHGIAFYQSENGVWLTNHVPVKYLQHLKEK